MKKIRKLEFLKEAADYLLELAEGELKEHTTKLYSRCIILKVDAEAQMEVEPLEVDLPLYLTKVPGIALDIEANKGYYLYFTLNRKMVTVLLITPYVLPIN